MDSDSAIPAGIARSTDAVAAASIGFGMGRPTFSVPRTALDWLACSTSTVGTASEVVPSAHHPTATADGHRRRAA